MTTINIKDVVHGRKTAESRWARFGPYYAMLPVESVFDIVNKYSQKDDLIIDPFAGRGSCVYAGGVLGRRSLGIEINPVGWLYGFVKLKPARKSAVVKRLNEIHAKRNYFNRKVKNMPLFYRMCYCDEVLRFLLSARKYLDWEYNSVDATLMAVLLSCLHGKIGEGLSNQMKMAKSMGMNYSINWWRKNNLANPPEIDPVEFVMKKLDWRYAKGTPQLSKSQMTLGDSTKELDSVLRSMRRKNVKFSLLFTSPPYHSVADYHADQWIRLWLLGGPEIYVRKSDKHKQRFHCKENYYNLLDVVFGKCAKMMKHDSVIYVRTDKRTYTFDVTKAILKKHFPQHILRVHDKPFKKPTQTMIYGNTSSVDGERDIILSRV